MPDTMRVPRRERHYRPGSRIPGRVARAVALRTGHWAATCEQWLHGHWPLDVRVAVWLEEAIRAGDLDTAKRILTRIEDAVVAAGLDLYIEKVQAIRHVYEALIHVA